MSPKKLKSRAGSSRKKSKSRDKSPKSPHKSPGRKASSPNTSNTKETGDNKQDPSASVQGMIKWGLLVIK